MPQAAIDRFRNAVGGGRLAAPAAKAPARSDSSATGPVSPGKVGHRRVSGFVGAIEFGRIIGGVELSAIALAAMVAVSVAAQFWAPAQLALEFDRHAIAAWQWWRVVSGNFVHYNWLHLAADVWAFAVLCYLARRERLGVLRLVLVACIAIGLAVYFLTDEIATYRGLSGVDMALLAAVLTRLARRNGPRVAAVCAGVIALETAKAVFDTVTGGCTLPSILPDGIHVVGIAHLAGLTVGVMAALSIPTRTESIGELRQL